MYKCWNCGTEHELASSNDEFLRGWNAAIKQLYQEYYDSCSDTKIGGYPCEDCFDVCEWIEGRIL